MNATRPDLATRAAAIASARAAVSAARAEARAKAPHLTTGPCVACCAPTTRYGPEGNAFCPACRPARATQAPTTDNPAEGTP